MPVQLSGRDGVLVLLGIGAVAAGVLAITLPRLSSTPPPVPVAAPPAAEMAGVMVMVTREEVPRGAVVGANALRPLKVASLPAMSAITRMEDAIGRVAVESIPAGQVLLREMVTADPAKAGLAPLVPAGRRAVTVRVADDTGLGSFLRAGDMVDLLIVVKDEDLPKPPGAGKQTTGDESEARLLLDALPVLAVGDTLAEAPANEKARPERVRILTLAATPEQTVRIALTRHLGLYSFTLRNPADTAVAEAGMATLADLRGEPKHPAPRPVVRTRAPAAGPEIIRGPVAAGKRGS